MADTSISDLDCEFSPPFEVIAPANWSAPVIFNSPHSGSVYPRAFLDAARINLATLRRSEDCFVDELIAGVAAKGLPVMRACFPRSYVDVNREPYELDPRMFTSRLPSYANTRSMRVAGGLGTIPRVVGDGQEIYRDRIAVDDALSRVEALYKPYHRALRRLVDQAQRTFGMAILVDCHSMPSVGITRDEPKRCDVVIGDRYGTSCAPGLSDKVEALFRDANYSVWRNRPYAGGFITEHYGHPAAGIHTIQIELNRAVYMDERKRERGPRFAEVADTFGALADSLASMSPLDLLPYQTAAE